MAVKTRTILLDAHRLRWALRAALAAASKDDVTPVLTAVSWQVRDKHIHLLATDRYRVHETLIPRPKGVAQGEFLMHRAQAEWILANSHKPARHYSEQSIRITWTADDGPGRIKAEVIASSEPDAPVFIYDTAAVKGVFPPVHRLFSGHDGEEARQEAVGLDPSLVARLADLVQYRGEPLIFSMPKQADGKTGPVMVRNTHGTARALVQPNLLTRAEVWQGEVVNEVDTTQEAAA